MIKTLQKKFIITAMAAITVLLLVFVAAVSGINYWVGRKQEDRTLVMLTEKEMLRKPGMLWKEPEKNQPGGGILEPPRKVVENERYFVVHFDQNGAVDQADVSQTPAVTEEEARAYGMEAIKTGQTEGRTDGFHYRFAGETGEGGKTAVFLDTSDRQRNSLMVFGISVFIGCLCWLCMFLLVALLSKRAIRPIAENMEKQKQFVTNAGHEIKTPLAIILANTDAMELHTGENKWTRNIRSQTRRLNGLMQNLLTLSRMEEGGAGLPAAEFDLSCLLEETLEGFEESAALRKLDLYRAVQPEVKLYANRENIRQMISILLDNSVKYADEGGKITVFLKKQERHTILQVENSVEKLPEGEPEQLFDRFYRGDSARTQKNGGCGIGLSVARAIAEGQKGTIRASFPGENRICFTVKL